MADTERRGAERRARMSNDSLDELARRLADKRAGRPGVLDLSLAHSFEVVGAPNHPTYGQGLAMLREGCEGIAIQPYHLGQTRPFTFAENLRARLESDDPLLWDTYLNSCTGVLYKGNPDGGVVEFKIVPMSEDLLYLPESFNSRYLPVAFNSVETEETFRADQVAVNQVLTPAQAREHRPWLAAAGYDQQLLNDYVERAEAKARETGNNLENSFMTFRTLDEPKEDQLRSLVVHGPYNSNARGNESLNDLGRFVRVGLP